MAHSPKSEQSVRQESDKLESILQNLPGYPTKKPTRMDLLKEKIGKNLTVSVKTWSGHRTIHDQRSRINDHLTGKVSPKVLPRMAPLTSEREFRELSEAAFQKQYKILDEVMESTNRGMAVMYARRLQDSVICVVKVRNRQNSFRLHADEEEWRATTLEQMNMPQTETICQVFDCIVTPRNYYVVMERVHGKDLLEHINTEKPLLVTEVREIIYQLVEALQGMHSLGRIHKDLKLENVMLDMNCQKEPSSPGGKKARSRTGGSIPEFELMKCSEGEMSRQSTKATSGRSNTPSTPTSPGIKIIDFDTVTNWEPSSPKSRDVLGTDGYIAPEAYGGIYSPASDVYQVGVIMYKLLTKKFPHRGEIFDDMPGENWVGSPAMKRIQERLKKEVINFNHAPLSTDSLATDLCKQMLAYDYSERPSAEQILEHKWFAMA